MNKACKVMLLAVLLSCAGMTVWAEPAPTKLVEVFPKPGVDFAAFKSMGTNPAVNIKPSSSWDIDQDDPFFKLRIQSILERLMQQQGFILVETADADLKLKLTVKQWGRLRSSGDLNLMEYVTVEARVYAVASGELVLRATGKYNRIDPLDNTPDKMNEGFASLMNEMLAPLRPKAAEKTKPEGQMKEAVTESPLGNI